MKKIFLSLVMLGVLNCLLWAGQGRVFAKIEKDVAYKKADPADVMDIYYPEKGNKPYPTHVYLHGGGWVGGRKAPGGKIKTVFEILGEAGFLGIAVEYRLVNRKRSRYMRTCVVDCMDALRYIFAHAKALGVDTRNVFVWGGSAGGHLTLLCATAPQSTFPGENPVPEGGIPIKAVVAWYPPADMLHYEAISVEYNKKLRDLSQRIGRTVETDPVAFIEISPLAHLTKNDPPSLIFHGDHDKVVHLQHSIRFQNKAKTLDLPCELCVVKNAGHGFGSRTGRPVEPGVDVICKRTAQFFMDHVSKPTKSGAAAGK